MRTPSLHPSWISRFETQGIQKNRNKEFNLRFLGEEILELTALLERITERGGPYHEVAELVSAAEMIRDRARDAGF